MRPSRADLEHALKEAIQREYEVISKATRRKNILTHYLSRSRLGVHPDVVMAEIVARGETLELMESE